MSIVTRITDRFNIIFLSNRFIEHADKSIVHKINKKYAEKM